MIKKNHSGILSIESTLERQGGGLEDDCRIVVDEAKEAQQQQQQQEPLATPAQHCCQPGVDYSEIKPRPGFVHFLSLICG